MRINVALPLPVSCPPSASPPRHLGANVPFATANFVVPVTTTTFLPNGKVDTRLLDGTRGIKPSPSFPHFTIPSRTLLFSVAYFRNVSASYSRPQIRDSGTGTNERIIVTIKNFKRSFFFFFFPIKRIRGGCVRDRVRDPIYIYKDATHRQSLDEWPLPVAHHQYVLTSCVAAVSLDDDLVDALIGSITGHIISFKAFHHRSHYL